MERIKGYRDFGNVMIYHTNGGRLLRALFLTVLVIRCSTASAVSVFDVNIVQREAIEHPLYDERITLQIGNRSEIVLTRNSEVFASASIVRSTGHAPGARRFPESLQGVVEDENGSWVRLTIDGDAVSGIIDIGRERRYIRSAMLRRSNFPTRLQRLDGMLFPPPPAPPTPVNRQVREVVNINNQSTLPTEGDITRVARIGVVIDNLYLEALGGRGLHRAISTINEVDGIYREKFGLALHAAKVLVITDDDTLQLGDESLQDNLARFRDYRLQEPELDANLSMVHLFSGAFTNDLSVGLAYVGSACRNDGYDVSVSLPFRHPTLLSAHEIGHNLGALHDDETPLCNLSTDRLMYSHISETTTQQFSHCSSTAIQRQLAQRDCHIQAIDMSVKMARDGETDLAVVIHNADTNRLAPATNLSLTLKNASIAAAPASCEIDSAEKLQCQVPAIAAGESLLLSFSLHSLSTAEKTLFAELSTVDFIDPEPANNAAEIIIEATAATVDNLVVAANDPSGQQGVDAQAATGGSGGGTPCISLFCLMLLSWQRRHGSNRWRAR